MKGLLKGLRYLSDIFEHEKEQEMQIGAPTDVKHVAHIGQDGPASHKPSWMTEFNAAQELSSNAVASNMPSESLPPTSKDKQKKSRRKGSAETGIAEESAKERRHRPTNSAGSSPGRDSSSHGRRNSGLSTGAESPLHDLPDVPKKSRRKKSKASAGGSDGKSLPGLTDLEI